MKKLHITCVTDIIKAFNITYFDFNLLLFKRYFV